MTSGLLISAVIIILVIIIGAILSVFKSDDDTIDD